MAELTTEYLDRKLDGVKEHFDDRMSTLRQDVGDVRGDVAALQEDVNTLQADISALRSDMNTKFDAMFELLDVRKKIEQLESDMRNVKNELKLA